MLLTLFPSERPVFTEQPPEGDGAVITLVRNPRMYAAHTVLIRGGEAFKGSSQVPAVMLKDRLSEDSLLQKAVKLSFYRAAVSSGVKQPPWGALTGIRPGKIVTKLLERGADTESAKRELVTGYYVSPERAELCLDTAKAGLKVKSELQKRDICLYVGIPFCPTRCSYCSFVSHSVEKSMKLIEPYLEALEREIAVSGGIAGSLGCRVVSLYIGGGTPTTLSSGQLRRLHTALSSAFDLSQLREYTVEAGRPDTITEEKLTALRESGVTRISINPQSMQDDVLEAIGRKHTAQQAFDAFALASRFDFDCVNADLIAGLPADTPEGFEYSLRCVLEAGCGNITVHNLAIKRGSRLGTGESAPLPSPEDTGRMMDCAMQGLRNAGYAPYYLYRQKFMAGGFENVGWSRPGFESLYNICIMEELCTVLALGAGGSTKLVNPRTGRIERIFNPKYSYDYIRNIEKVLESRNGFRDFTEKEDV